MPAPFSVVGEAVGEEINEHGFSRSHFAVQHQASRRRELHGGFVRGQSLGERETASLLFGRQKSAP